VVLSSLLVVKPIVGLPAHQLCRERRGFVIPAGPRRLGGIAKGLLDPLIDAGTGKVMHEDRRFRRDRPDLRGLDHEVGMNGRGELQCAPTKKALMILGPVAAALVETAEIVASERQSIDLGAGVGGLVQYESDGLGTQALVVVE